MSFGVVPPGSLGCQTAIEANVSPREVFKGFLLTSVSHQNQNQNHGRSHHPAAPDIVVSLRNVMKIFRMDHAQVLALKDISLDIIRGEFTAIIGSSGAGKSTLMNIMGCIDQPTIGEIFINSKSVSRLSDRERARIRNRDIGFVFQSFNLIPVLNVFENVQLPLVLRPENSDAENYERAVSALRDVGMLEYGSYRPEKLSGGQRQRVAIARAMVTAPMLLLADEPTANLDSETSKQIIDLMVKLNETKGVTFIFSSHDDRLIGRVRRVIKIKDGLLTE